MSQNQVDESVIDAAASQTQPAGPSNAPPPVQMNLLEKALPLLLQLCLSGALKTLGPASESESCKLAFKLHTMASFINLTLILVLVVHLVAFGTGAMQLLIASTVKRIMWATLAVSYFTIALGTILNLMA